MGLFTNRKRNEEDVDGLSEAASLLAQFGSSSDDAPDEVAPLETDIFQAEPITDFFPVGAVDDVAVAPIADASADVPGNPVFPAVAAEEAVVAPPKRRLEDRPRAQAGNVEIDAEGLLSMLGVDDTATLIDISEARQRFLADHQPIDTDDTDAAQIKEAIRREVNTAYASFRLTYAA